MTKKRHSALLTALTLVLGIAILTTTLAVPQMRSVQSLAARAEGATETQVMSTAAASAQENAALGAEQSPTHITVGMPAIPSDPGVLPSDPGGPNDWVYRPLAGDNTGNSPIPYPYRVWEHEKDGDNAPKGITAPYDTDPAATDWRVLESSTLLDIFSSYKSKSSITGSPHTPPVRDDDLNYDGLEDMDILVPGCAGQYMFTIENTNPSVSIEYLINLEEILSEIPNKRSFPLLYRLIDDLGNVLTGASLLTGWKYMNGVDGIADKWLPIDVLPSSVPGKLAPGATRTFILDWEWEYERGVKTGIIAAGDGEDTGLGWAVQAGLPVARDGEGDWEAVPQYQLRLNLLVRAPDYVVTVIFDYNGGSGTPGQRDYSPGDTLGPLPIPDPWLNHTFKHWRYADGTIATPNDPVPLDGSVTLYAEWDEDPVNQGGWKYIPIPLPIPIPIPLPIIPIMLPCWKCLRPQDKCICEKPGKTEPFAKTGDSMATVYSALALLTVAGGVALYLHRKRREEDE